MPKYFSSEAKCIAVFPNLSGLFGFLQSVMIGIINAGAAEGLEKVLVTTHGTQQSMEYSFSILVMNFQSLYDFTPLCKSRINMYLNIQVLKGFSFVRLKWFAIYNTGYIFKI